MERGRGGREGGDREGEREREAGREGGARAKPGNQLVCYMETYNICQKCQVSIASVQLIITA